MSPRRSCGFTLIELLVVVAVIALLISILLPSLAAARAQAERVLCASRLRQWGIALRFYLDEFNDWLPTEGNANATSIVQDGTWYNELPPYVKAPKYRDYANVDSGSLRELDERYPRIHIWICPTKFKHKNVTSGSNKNQFHYAMNGVLDGFGSSSSTPPWLKEQGSDSIRLNEAIRVPGESEATTVFMFDEWGNSASGGPGDAGCFHRDTANILFVDGHVDAYRPEDFVVDGNFGSGRVLRFDHSQLYWGGYRGPPTP